MPATGTNPVQADKKSIRLTTDGFSFYPGREIVLVNGRSTWMPMAEFTSNAVVHIYNKVYAPTATPSNVRYNILPTLEVIELWSVARDTERQLTEQYPTHRWMGGNGVVLERVFAYERHRGAGRRFYAYCHDGELFVFNFNENGLFYANSFWPKTDEEARYYMFGVWQRLGYDAEKDEMLLITADHLHAMLTPYIRHIALLTPELMRLPDAPDTPFDVLCAM